MEVLSLDFLFSLDFLTIEHTQSWDVEQYLGPVVLLVLDWIVAEVKLCEETQLLDVLQLEHLLNAVERKVEEPQ